MKDHRVPGRRAACPLLALAALTSACALGAHRDPTRFYVLEPTASPHARAVDAPAVGLGPIALPGYLQSRGIATRAGTEIRYAELDRWAEPLPTMFGRALGQDLSAQLETRVVQYPWYRSTRLGTVVELDVAAFEADAAGGASLDACWTLRDARTTRMCRGCASIAEMADDRSVEARVAALSRAVGELARRIASEVASCAPSS